MSEPNMEELEFLAEIFEKHPLDSLKKIAEVEGIDYYRLKRLYDKYYGKHITVSAIYDIKKLGLRSFLVFMSVPVDKVMEVLSRLTKNPFLSYANVAFGFKNGISAVFHIPDKQKHLIPEMLSKYSGDYEYYEVRAYPFSGEDDFGDWYLSYEYAILMDILKWDARTPITEMSRRLGKSRPTIRYMIKRLENEGIVLGFVPIIDANVHDRSVIGLARDLDEEVLERFKEYEILPGVLPEYGYVLEWFFSSKEDLGSKILEFSRYVDKLLIEYVDPLTKELNDMNLRNRFSRMVKKDGSGYRSILEF